MVVSCVKKEDEKAWWTNKVGEAIEEKRMYKKVLKSNVLEEVREKGKSERE